MREFRGELERVKDSVIVGWAQSDDGDGPHVQIRLRINNVEQGPFVANLFRDDLRRKLIGNGHHGFKIFVADGAFRAGDNTIEMFGQPENIQIGGTLVYRHDDDGAVETRPSPVAAPTPQPKPQPAADPKPAPTPAPQPAAAPAATRSIRGKLERVKDAVIYGWAFNDTAPSEKVSFALVINGAQVSTHRADLMRGDLADARIGNGAHGFMIDLPERHLKAGDNRIEVRRLPEGTIIDEPLAYVHTPAPLNDAPPFETVPATYPTPHKPGVPTVGVIGWDLGHNPVGRSYLVAELLSKAYNVELLGPIFPQYGSELWKPLHGATKLPIHTFRCVSFADFVTRSIEFVKSHPYDVVHACKPRFSAMFLALLYKLIWNSAVVVDVDDYELSFFNTEKGYSFSELEQHLTEADWKQPYLENWTRYANNMMDIADSVTVSNPTLMRLFGGIIVRHARDETVFDPKLYDRVKVRAEFGFKPSDRVILFIGTPRLHKGILDIAEALDEINDPNAVLCIIGTINDKRVRNAFDRFKKARIVFFNDQPFRRLAELTTMADVMCILQAPDHAVAQHQIPAKLTDALAMGVPVIATHVPPMADLIASGAVIGVANEELAPRLKALLASPEAMERQGKMGRRFFATDFSYQVNVPRLQMAVDQALEERKPASGDYRALLKLMHAKLDNAFPPGDFATLLNALPATTQRWGGPVNFREKVNIAYFWKQNDSGVYGRRQDMLVKYLLSSGRVGTIVHFDAPIGVSQLLGNVVTDDTAKFQQGNFVVRNTIERFLKMQDAPGLLRRTFVYDDRDGATLLGRDLPKLSGFADFVAASLEEAGIKTNLMAVVCPVLFDMPAVMEKVEFPFVMADVIDNHLAWPVKPAYEARLRANYEHLLGQADAVFANCAPVQDAMLEFTGSVHIVPNGGELFPEGHAFPRPEHYRRMTGPIIGYVGNLRDRVRFDLIARIAEENPDWNIVLIGSAHGNQTALTLRKYPNVHLHGVVPYEEALNHIACFDVAMIPHELTKLTESMNPLKLYVYSAVGVPVVSTPVPNIDDLRDAIYVADDDDGFIASIRQAMADKAVGRARKVSRDVMRDLSWQQRVEDIFQVLEAASAARS